VTGELLGLYYHAYQRPCGQIDTAVFGSLMLSRREVPTSGGASLSSSVTSQKGWLMPKALCLIALVIASLVFLIFLLDLVLGLSGLTNMAPFRTASVLMDILFMLASGALAYSSWLAFREQR
jgi:hypothetical protein